MMPIVRTINNMEKKIINDEIYKNWRLYLDQLLRNHAYMVLNYIHSVDVYAVDNSTIPLIRDLESKELIRYLAYLGLFIGRIKTKYRRISFTPSLELGHIVSINAKRNLVKVTDEGEKLFLYGRDLFTKSIVDARLPLLRNHYIVVINKNNEYVGLGIALRNILSLYDLNKLKITDPELVLIKNYIDLGWYLRKGG